MVMSQPSVPDATVPQSPPSKAAEAEAAPPPPSVPASSENVVALAPDICGESGKDTSEEAHTPPADDDVPMGETPLEAMAPIPEVPEEWLNLSFKWSGKTYEMRVNTSDLIYDFRSAIETLTSVPASAQKILGLGRTQLRADSDGNRISTLNIKDGAKFTVVGTPEHLRFKEPDITTTEEWDLSYPLSSRRTGSFIPPALDPRNLRCVQHIIKTLPIEVMNPPRPGKRLLVLDLDYTIADTRPLLDGALPPLECARPGLHEFLDRVYEHYDIAVWSQTRWTWLETKLVELGVLGADAAYKICFVADRTSMFPIFNVRNGQMIKHEVKPLAYCWATFPHWSARNSIHIDDLGRNFALNPGEGLKIRAFKGAGTEVGMRDRELDRLGHYLCDIAREEDFTVIDHNLWKKRAKKAEAKAAALAAPAGAGEGSGNGGPAAGTEGGAGATPDGAGANSGDP